MRSSQAAFDLIVAEEVSSETAYSKKYRKPEWPGAQSGATVGIGYDLGQTPKATVIADWKGRVPDDMLAAMTSACGITGARARAVTMDIRSDVDIPWNIAIAVHKECVIPRWEAKVASSLPNTDKLTPDCFGALLSLTFNRGPSFSTAGDRYREMRAIKTHMASQNFGLIPDEFRSMKRLWPDLAGLRARRENEAKLFEKGLRSKVASSAPAIPKAAAPALSAFMTPKSGPSAAPSAAVVPATPPPTSITLPIEETPHGDPELWNVQRRLKAIMYNPGGLDGIWGGLTAGAITGFINDRQLTIAPPASIEAFHDTQQELKLAIGKAEAERFTRPIAPERALATAAELAPKLPEVQAAATAERLGFWGSIATGVSAVTTGISKSMGDAVEWLNPLKTFVGDLPWPVWVGGAVVVAGALYYISTKSGDAKNASTEAYKAGERV